MISWIDYSGEIKMDNTNYDGLISELDEEINAQKDYLEYVDYSDEQTLKQYKINLVLRESYKTKYMQQIERQIKQVPNSLEEWLNQPTFPLNSAKSSDFTSSHDGWEGDLVNQ
jgi:hypothetical protein